MGKSLISQKRGKGSPTYRAKSHRSLTAVKYLLYDEKEKNSRKEGIIKDIVHSPGHHAPLAIIQYGSEITFNFAPHNIYAGKRVYAGKDSPIEIGNILPLKAIPEGTEIFNIESHPGDGGKFVRTPGTKATVISKWESKVIIQFPSKKQKEFDGECRATIGMISASGRKEKPFLRAGRRMHAMRSKNRLYPKVSAVSMNAVQHPFGSGRGSHKGKSTITSRNAPPGRKVGLISARRTGKKK